MSMKRISHQLVEFYDKFASWEHSVVKGSGLSPTQVHTIEVIGYSQELRMKELAERLGVTTGTLTIGIDKLEKKGLVERRPHQQDRRSWLVGLTEKGREVFEEHHRFHLDYTQEITTGLSSSEVKALSSLLGRVLDNM